MNITLRRPVLLAAGVMTAVALAWTASLDFVNRNPLFHPHGYCYLWQGNLVGAHVISDALIAASYLTISLTLLYLVRRAERAIPFHWMFLAFGLFIVACGLTHVMEIVTLWQPWFWMSADVKGLTAVASVSTAIALPPLVPRILNLVSDANVSEERRVALERANAELEQRVLERTLLLSEAMAREQALRERAEEANRLKDEFLSTISHELRTPLTAILGWGEMLVKKQLAADATDRALQSILRNARAQTQLVDDLLDMSRMTTGKLRLERRLLSFDQLVHAAVESITPVAAAKRIQIDTTEPWAPSFIIGDANRLQQVVWNLLTNAVKFTPDGGQVSIALTIDAKVVRLEVVDSGIGLDPAFMTYIFERFRQADSSSTRQRQGLGLGLSLARELTELHGGRIEARSDGLGRGATFIVELPATHAPSPIGAALGDDTPRLDGVRILVVDDEADGVEVVTAALQKVGAIVTPAYSAMDALNRLRGTTIDLIVSDLSMPQQDGCDLMRMVRRDMGWRVPAIALTARVRREDRASALAAGFQLHVSKPVVPSELVIAIHQLLRDAAATGV